MLQIDEDGNKKYDPTNCLSGKTCTTPISTVSIKHLPLT